MKRTKSKPPLLAGQQVALHSKHLRSHTSSKTINLPRVLFHLSRVEQSLQSARLSWQLEQPLPLIFGKEWLFRSCARRVLRLALLLPCGDLGLLTSELSLVVLVVVEFGVVVLDALEEQIARLLEEGVDGKVERIVVGEERRERGVRVLLQGR